MCSQNPPSQPTPAPHACGREHDPRCHSLLWFDKFILHQRKQHRAIQRCGQMLTGGHAPADFSIGPMTLASARHLQMLWLFQPLPCVWCSQRPRGHHHLQVESVARPVLLLLVSTDGLVSSQHQYEERMTGVQNTHKLGREQTRERRCESGREREQSHHVLKGRL